MTIIMPGIVAAQQQLLVPSPTLIAEGDHDEVVQNGTAINIPVPAGAADGDFLIFVIGGSRNQNVDMNVTNDQGTLTGTGLVRRRTILVPASYCQQIFYKTYDTGSDPSSFDFTYSHAVHASAHAMVWRNMDSYDTRHAFTWTSAASQPINLSATAANPNTIAIFSHHLNATNGATVTGTPSDNNETYNFRDTTTHITNTRYRNYVSWKLFPSSGATGNQGFTFGSLSTSTIALATSQMSLFYQS